LSERSPGVTSGALVLGLLGSAGAALPAFFRVLPDGHALGAGVALWGSVSLLVVPVGVWLRRSRAATWPPADRALLAGAALSALPLALFGGVLKSTTHHRPLGGATFAVAALCLLALCIGLSFRVLGKGGLAAVKAAWQNLFTLGCGLSLASAVVLGLSRSARPSLVDFLALAGGVAVVSWVKLPGWLSRPRGLGPALAGWVILLLCAVVSARGAGISRSLTTQAPVSFAPLSWLGDGS